MTAQADFAGCPRNRPNKAFDAGVAPREAVAVHQVLIDGLGVSSLAQRQFDEVEVGLAGTARRAAPGQRDRRRVGGHRWPVLAGARRPRRWTRSGDTSLAGFAGARRPQPPGARMATPAALEVSSRRFPANACFLLDAPQRPAQPPQRDDLLSLLFAQDIAHVDGG